MIGANARRTTALLFALALTGCAHSSTPPGPATGICDVERRVQVSG
jgi:hypothetical protein